MIGAVKNPFSYWQFASVVVEDGEEVLHGQLVPARLQQKVGGDGRCTFEELTVVRSRGEEGASRKVMENAGERPVHTRNVGVCPVRDWKQRSFGRMQRKKSRKGYKANDNVSPLLKSTWNK